MGRLVADFPCKDTSYSGACTTLDQKAGHCVGGTCKARLWKEVLAHSRPCTTMHFGLAHSGSVAVHFLPLHMKLEMLVYCAGAGDL